MSTTIEKTEGGWLVMADGEPVGDAVKTKKLAQALLAEMESAPSEDDEMTLFVLHAHYPNGGSEVWATKSTLRSAEKAARSAMRSNRPAKLEDGTVDPDGGGIKWMEVFGPGIEESIGFERNENWSKVLQTA